MTSASQVAIALAVSLAATLPATRASADDNHYQNYVVGERALGLGGAFVAIADDAAGAYYNPAGLAEVDHSSLSLSAALYGFASESYHTTGASFESDNQSFVSYPTTAAWLQRVRRGGADGSGRIQLSLSLITPQSNVTRRRYSYQRAVPSTTAAHQIVAQTIAVEIAEDDTLWIGLAAAWKIHRRLSVGGTLFTTVRNGLYQVYSDEVYRTFDAASGLELGRFAYADRLDLSLSHLAMIGVVGVVVPLTDRLRLGAAFRTPSAELRGRAEMSRIYTPADASGKFSIVAREYQNARFRDRQPWKATLGAAYLAPRRFGLAVDVAVFGPVGEYAALEHPDEPSVAASVRMKKRPVVQVGAGGEVYLGGTVPVRAGFFTNLSSLGRMEDCDASGVCIEHQNLFTDGVDLYGFSASVGYEIDRATLNLGVSYAFGARTTALPGGELEARRSYLFVALGGSFRF